MAKEGDKREAEEKDVRAARITRNGTIWTTILTVVGTPIAAVLVAHLWPEKPGTDPEIGHAPSRPVVAQPASPSVPQPAPVVPAPARPGPIAFQQTGFGAQCPNQTASAAIARFSGSAIEGAERARTTAPVTLLSAVGGDEIGRLPSQTIVRVVCAIGDGFVVVKEEQGTHEGVVERQALRPLL